jgi:cell wall-associated NlpC family hydrolase
MDGIGVTLLVSGAWFIYAAIQNVKPIRTITEVIKDPGKARSIISSKEFKIDPNATITVTAPPQTNTPATPEGLSGLQGIPVSGTPTSTGSGATIVAFARTQIGKPYIFGGTGNPGWDCSGLVQASLKTVAVDVSHSALSQLLSTKGKIISGASVKNTKDLRPGDIIFPAAAPELLGNHVAIYSGNGNIIEAAYPGTNVRERALYPFLIAKRFTLG